MGQPQGIALTLGQPQGIAPTLGQSTGRAFGILLFGRQKMSERRMCISCRHEDTSRQLSSSEPNYPGKAYELGFAIWCEYWRRFIDNEERQGIRKRDDGSMEKEWCTMWIHY